MSSVPMVSPHRPGLRLWPGVLLVALEWGAWYGGPIFLPGDAKAYGAMAGLLLGALGIPLWWLFASRAPRLERWGAVGLMIAAMAGTPRLLDRSVAEGNMGFQFYLYAIPTLTLAFVIWAAIADHLPLAARRVTMVATILAACGAFALLRSEGLTGQGGAELVWRWAQSPEERLLEEADEALPRPGETAAAVPTEIHADWPGFRGPHRDGAVLGTRLATDWKSSPPEELWRRPIGPATSSFAVGGGLVYTQEQRGEDEIVSCYELATGEPVWAHRDTARFWDSHVGAGPRATPALGGGRVYSLGATGIMNALDARDGEVVWSRDAAADTGAPQHMFGFVGSPLVLGDDVIVATGSRLVAYDAATGEPLWFGPPSGAGYSSPQLVELGGTRQIVLMTGRGVIAVAPSDGSLLWQYAWPGIGIVQPLPAAARDVLISQSSDIAAPIGTRRLAVSHGPGGWTAEERWESRGLKPSFSSFVVHEGYAYGFDGRILAAIDLATGERAWKGGRYGSGSLLLLADQDLLLVLSERGEVALVSATPDRFRELGRFPAIEGRTWSQPVLVGDTLLVRNNEEMAAFRLARASG